MPPLLDDNRARLILVVVLLALAQALATAVAAFATRDIFEMLSQQENISHLPFYRLLFAGITIAFLYCLHKKTAEVLGQSYVMRCRGDLHDHVMRLSVSRLQQKRHGQLALRFIGDLTAIKNWVANGITQLISAVLIIPSAAMVLWWLSPDLFQAAMLPIGVAIVTLFSVAKFIKPLHENLRRQRGKLSSDMVERLSIAPFLQLMGRTDRDKKQLIDRSRKILISAARRSFAKAGLRMIPDIGCAAASVGVLCVALSQSLSTATAAGALAIIGILGSPLRQLASVWDRRCAWLIAREKYLDILSMPTLAHANQPLRFKKGALSVVLRFVRISGVQPINFTIKAGERVLLSGASEAEKKQLLYLIAGLEDAEHGQIYINDSPMADVRAANINHRIHMLSMNMPMLKGSLRRTMTLGVNKRPNDKILSQRADKFGLRNTIARLGGLDGRVFEKGSNLSQSEICRIQLLRCSFSKPDLLLVDDIASYCDKSSLKLLNDILINTPATVIAKSLTNRISFKPSRILYLQETHSNFHVSLIN